MDKSPTPERPDQLTPMPAALGTPPPAGLPAQVRDEQADPAAPTTAPPPPMTPMAWLTNNGIYLVLIATGITLLYRSYGLDGLWRALLVIFGLGMVIFIHELGHFLAAKWCDVHVQTFSIGFGPALPGCSFQRGETLYKIGILPLGGYVNMVGEGTDVEENEDYPRSFKNKTVLQRMLIISAGVIMNIILGAILFVVVYLAHGVERPPAIVYNVECGSASAKAGVRTGWKIIQIGNIKNPYFDDLRVEVALGDGTPIPFTFERPDGTTVTIDIVPRKDRNDPYPVIGVAAPSSLRLIPREFQKFRESAVAYATPAADARVFNLQPDDVVLKASDPDKDGEVTDLPAGKEMEELCRRMRALGKKPLVLEVKKADGKIEKDVKVEAVGFEFGDTIIGTTDPASPNQPFKVAELPPNPYPDPKDPKPNDRNLFEFRSRMRLLADKPVVIQVLRDKGKSDKEKPDKEMSEPPVNILVPPAYQYSLGVNMKMGEVSAVRVGSPAKKAGVTPTSDTEKGDELKKIVLEFGPEKTVEIPMADPTRIPYELVQATRKGKPTKVIVTVLRPNKDNHRELNPTKLEMDWDDNWDSQNEAPMGVAAPLSIPQLGIAYRVLTEVTEVKKGSSAEKAGIQVGDVFDRISFRIGGKKADEVQWTNLSRAGGDLKSKRGPNGTEVPDRWAHFAWALPRGDFHDVKVKVKRGDKLLDEPIELKGEADLTWAIDERGLEMRGDLRLQKADTVMQALGFGFDSTTSFIKQMYLNLGSLISGRISTDTLGGPIELASQTFAAADDIYLLLRFLGMISLNLAVVNFLPIPVLDGGHMVFLIYEAIRRRKPSETVQAIATYAGLAVIFSLMLFVFYLDIKRRILGL